MGDLQVQSHPQQEAGQTQVKTNRPYHVLAPSKKPDTSKNFQGMCPLSADTFP